MRVSFVLPCRNEEKTIAECIQAIKNAMRKIREKSFEIIVSDSSADNSALIAEKNGAKVVRHGKEGYGIACLEGFKKASGEIIVFGDADCTYDFAESPKLLKALSGCDFVLGERKFIMPGAMPLLHRLVGNPVLSFLLRLFFGAKVKDAHSGFRAIRKKQLARLKLKTTGMEFASEMIVKAIKAGLKIEEVPVHYYPRKKSSPSKLKSFGDGWRHLRFMLMYAPGFLFMIPGLLFFSIGLVLSVASLFGPIFVNNFGFYNSPMIAGGFLLLLGYQIILTGLYARTFAVSAGFEARDDAVDLLARFVSFESGIAIGALMLLAALFSVFFQPFFLWKNSSGIIFTLVLAVLAFQTLFSAFFLSLLLVNKK